MITIKTISNLEGLNLLCLNCIFDQSQRNRHSSHILEVDEMDFPKHYQEIIRKLQRAVLNEQI